MKRIVEEQNTGPFLFQVLEFWANERQWGREVTEEKRREEKLRTFGLFTTATDSPQYSDYGNHAITLLKCSNWRFPAVRFAFGRSNET